MLGTVQEGHMYKAQEETSEKQTEGVWVSFEFSALISEEKAKPGSKDTQIAYTWVCTWDYTLGTIHLGIAKDSA